MGGRVTEVPFGRFYEELLAMAREGVPTELIVRKIRRAVPDRDSRRGLVGHLRDSRDAFEVAGQAGTAAILDEVIESLEGPQGCRSLDGRDAPPDHVLPPARPRPAAPLPVSDARGRGEAVGAVAPVLEAASSSAWPLVTI